MRKIQNTRFVQTLFVPSLVMALALAGAGIILTACEPAQFSDTDTPTDTTKNTPETADFTLANRIQQEPRPLDVYLFPKSTVDFANPTGGTLVGTVEAGASKTFQVPAGSWKIAYQDRAGTLFPMVDEAAGGHEWLRSDFIKGGDYSVVLITDGNRTVWVPNYTTVPPISQ